MTPQRASNPPLSESQGPRPPDPHPQARRLCRWETKRGVGICTISPPVCGCSGSKARQNATSDRGTTGSGQPQLAGGRGTHCGQLGGGDARQVRTRWVLRWLLLALLSSVGAGVEQVGVRSSPRSCFAVFIAGVTSLESHVTLSPRDFLLNI